MANYIRILNTFTVWILVLQFAVVVQPGCSVLSESISQSQPNGSQITLAHLGQSYQGTVNSCTKMEFKYTYLEFGNVTSAVRITANILSDVDDNSPVQFVARQKQGILSWQIPFVLQYRYAYDTVSTTLCPLDAADRTNMTTQQTIYLDVSTMEKRNINFTVKAVRVSSFLLQTNERLSLNITPSEPQYYMYTFPANVDAVVVTATSDDDLCMTLSVQDFRCPVYDLDRNIRFLGAHQTMTKQAAITAKKSNFLKHSFFVVMVLKPKDTKCHGVASVARSGDTRTKTLSIKIVPAASATMYYAAISTSIIALLVFSVVAYIIYWVYCEKILRPFLFTKEENHCEILANDEVNVIREKNVLYVSDLAKTSASYREMKFIVYCSTLAVISIFYGLPVLQLVLTYQKMLHGSGNDDVCYYNFQCARSLGVLSSFNNLFSNIGYVILGSLFIILVWRRNNLYKDAMTERPHLENTYGIPQQNGLFYSMGFALCIEGVMSACYHICPNHSNFQYDTSFMYIIACLCMLRIYQNRHPDITPKSHTSFVVIAIVIFIAVLGVVAQSNTVWVLFWLLDTVGVLLIGIWLYYMGQIDITWKIFARICNFVIRERGLCSKPNYKGRFVLIATSVILNWLYATFGLVFRPPDFASFLLGMFIGNLLLHTLYYIIMKKIHKEKIQILTSVCILATAILWGFALYFFFAHLTSWQVTPAKSREGNQPCVLLDFFDKHDVWHFLSATSMFFSFMILLTVDDDLLTKRRNKIRVF